MKNFIKKIPIIYDISFSTRAIIRSHLGSYRLLNILKGIDKFSPLRIVIGSSKIYDVGWIPTDIEFFNILKKSDWNKYFLENSLDAILAEHVWEHLSFNEATFATKQCFLHLKPGGYLRIAVPDGFHPNSEYIEWVKVGGTGSGSEDHKVLYNYLSLSELLKNQGFKVRLLEYFDENGAFHCEDWNVEDGKVYRSKKYDKRNKDGILRYTSIIIDAIKEH